MNMRKTMSTLKTLLAAAFAVTAAGRAMAASVTVVDVANGNPRSTITVIYTLDNMDADPDCKVAFDITANGVKKGVTNETAKLTSGTYAKTIDTAALFGAARTDPKAKVSVSLIAAKSVEPQLGGVQLWENGPYWAECNVGASKPEEYGYYFWWGDTVGYKLNAAGKLVSGKEGSQVYFPFTNTDCLTYGKSISELQTEGYVDSTGNLLAAHDAATAHLGAPWRMPTKAEMDALINNCTSAWITTNGVSGRMFAGKGTYASKSIFIPAAGHGYYHEIEGTGSTGFYWSSTPNSQYSGSAWYLIVPSDYFWLFSSHRYYGCSVRPVRGFAQ